MAQGNQATGEAGSMEVAAGGLGVRRGGANPGSDPQPPAK